MWCIFDFSGGVLVDRKKKSPGDDSSFMSEWCRSGADMKKPGWDTPPYRDIFLILGEEF